MRVFLTPIIVLLVATSAWLGCLADPAAGDGPGVCQMVQNWVGGCQGPSEEQEPCEESGYVYGVPNTAPCGPHWSFAAEAIALERTAPRKQLLFVQPPSASTDSLYANDLNFPVALGFRVDGIRHDVCGCDWEVGYFQVDGFAADASVPGTSTMITNAIDPTKNPLVNNGEAHYKSAIYSGEVNVRTQWCDAVATLAGFRMGQLNEHYLGTGSMFTTFNPSRTDYTLATNTSNQLYGFQVGADVGVYDMGGPLQINVLCKAGIFDNFAHQNYQRLVVTNGIITSNDCPVAGRNQAAFLGETGAVATYALTKRLAFRASAQVLWLTGVALAPEQVTTFNLSTKRDSIDTSGAAFYYGGGMGVEYRF